MAGNRIQAQREAQGLLIDEDPLDRLHCYERDELPREHGHLPTSPYEVRSEEVREEDLAGAAKFLEERVRVPTRPARRTYRGPGR